MLDATSIKQARKLASAVCEARAIAEELSQDLHCDSMEAKNQHVSEAMENLAEQIAEWAEEQPQTCLLYTSPSPRDRTRSRMPSSA